MYLLDTSPHQMAIDVLDVTTPKNGANDARHESKVTRYYDLVTERSTVSDVSKRTVPLFELVGTLAVVTSLLVSVISES